MQLLQTSYLQPNVKFYLIYSETISSNNYLNLGQLIQKVVC